MFGNGVGYGKEIFISLFPNLCNQSLIVHNNLGSGIPPSFVKVRIKERIGTLKTEFQWNIFSPIQLSWGFFLIQNYF